jgi:hypothetical protein
MPPVRPTIEPPWNNDPDGWRRKYDAEPLRVTVVCEREGFEPGYVQGSGVRLIFTME